MGGPSWYDTQPRGRMGPSSWRIWAIQTISHDYTGQKTEKAVRYSESRRRGAKVDSVIISPGGEVTEGPTLGEAESFTLEQLREGIGGGWIEHIPLLNDLPAEELSVELVENGEIPEGCVVVADEEGTLKKQPPNELASVLCGRLVVGKVLIAKLEVL